MPPPSPPEKWVQMSLGSYGRSAQQHLFLLVLPMTTGAFSGQPDGASGLFVPGFGWVSCCRVLTVKCTEINKCSMTTVSVFPDKCTWRVLKNTKTKFHKALFKVWTFKLLGLSVLLCFFLSVHHHSNFICNLL